MDGVGSVTVWLDRLKAGDRGEAVTRLWQRYFGGLVTRARDHLRGRVAGVDGEDVALSAFDGFVRAVAAGRFPRLDGRDDLWQVLLVMTARKASNAARDAARRKRGGGRIAGTIGAGGDSDGDGFAVPSADPDPADAAALTEEFERLLDSLVDPQLRQIAVWLLEGYTNAEIGSRLGRAVATVERKRKWIRELWTDQGVR